MKGRAKLLFLSIRYANFVASLLQSERKQLRRRQRETEIGFGTALLLLVVILLLLSLSVAMLSFEFPRNECFIEFCSRASLSLS